VANRKISQLTALTTPAAGDYLPIVDISEAADADKNKRITIEELLRGAPDGTAAAPSIAFESDPDSGLYSTGANGLALATGGTGRLFIDSSGRVGVGASPGVFFDIDDPGTGLRFKNAGSGNFNIGLLGGISSSNSYIFNRANSPLILGTNNIERLHITSSGQLSHIGGGSVGSPAVAFNGSAPSNSLVIDSTGKVGVGTSSPAGNLHILSASGVNTLYLSGGSTNSNNGGTAQLTAAGPSGGWHNLNIRTWETLFTTNGTERLRITSDGTFQHKGAGTNGSPGSPAVSFNGSAPSNSLVIDSSGNVGIGGTTTTGWAQKQVVLDAGSGASASYVLVNDTTGRTPLDGGLLTLSGSDLYLINRESANLIFRTANTERLRITSSGQLSHIGGGTSGSPAVSFNGSAPSNSLVIDSSGNVSIGSSTSISAAFTVVAQSNAEAINIRGRTTDNIGELNFWSNDETTRYAKLSARSTYVELRGPDGGSIRFNKFDGTESAIINSSGNVGIGTTSPTDKLNISSGTNQIALDTGNQSTYGTLDVGFFTNGAFIGTVAGSNSASNLLRLGTSGIERARIDSSGTFRVKGAGVAGTTDAVQFNGSAPANSLLLDASGRLGIGTSSPGERLHVSGGNQNIRLSGSYAASQSNKIEINNGQTGATRYAVGMELSSSAGGGYTSGVYASAGSDTRYRFISATPTTTSLSTANTTRLFIDSSGNVGIGTTNPGYNLQVAGANSTVAINATNASLSSVGTLLYRNTDGNGQPREVASIEGETAGNGGYGALAFQTAFNNSLFERARIDRNGRFLVGTVSSSANTRVIIAGNSGTPTAAADLRLQRGSANPASGVGLGALYFTDSNEVIGAGVSAVADGAWASNDYPTRLVFSTTADGSSSPTERMRITSGGFLCATESGSLKSTSLHNIKATSAQTTFAFYNTNASSPAGVLINFDSASPNATGNHFLYCSDLTAQRASIRSNGGLANYQSNNVDLSDERSKRNIAPASSTWNYVQAWEVVNYNYLEDAVEDAPRVGVIAQQVQQHCPDVVIPFQEAENAILDDDGNVVTPAKEERLGVREQQMMWMAIKALQEAQLRIEALEAKVAALEAQ